jgi:signal-transduction protein with cAMP-binding, CBS, and nucleotidyltransferase domain
MRNLGVRRLPVCREGRLVGMLALDDLLELCAHALHDLSVETLERRRRSARESRGEHAREELEELYEVLRDRLRYARWAAQEELLTDWDALKAKVRGILGLD